MKEHVEMLDKILIRQREYGIVDQKGQLRFCNQWSAASCSSDWPDRHQAPSREGEGNPRDKEPRISVRAEKSVKNQLSFWKDLSSDVVLKHYDDNKPVNLAADATPNGVAAVI